MSKDWTAVELKQNYDLIYVQKAQSKLYVFARHISLDQDPRPATTML